MKTVFKIGPTIASGQPPEAGITSLYTPHISGFFCRYYPGICVESSDAPLFAFTDLESALHWWRTRRQELQQSLFVWQAHSTEIQLQPPFVVRAREWPLWEEFWLVWRSGDVFSAEDWGFEDDLIRQLAAGTVLCRDITLTKLVDPALYPLS